MTTFLLWNVQKKSLDGHVVRLVQHHKVDFLVLIEHPEAGASLLQLLGTLGKFQRLPSHERFGVYTRMNLTGFNRLRFLRTNERIDGWHLRPRSGRDFLMVSVHGLDMRNHSDSQRALFFTRVAEAVEWSEAEVGHKRTVVLGDFNANPFEAAVGGVSGLHAIRLKEVSGRADRVVLGRAYPFFYNPMWACYGSSRAGVPGTYYFYGYGEHEQFWHMLDQVVLRPEMLPHFVEMQLRVVTEAGGISLLTEQRIPDEGGASDHLPVLFRLNLQSKGAKNAR